jgi:flagellar basal body-associated protein FliL
MAGIKKMDKKMLLLIILIAVVAAVLIVAFAFQDQLGISKSKATVTENTTGGIVIEDTATVIVDIPEEE